MVKVSDRVVAYQGQAFYVTRPDDALGAKQRLQGISIWAPVTVHFIQKCPSSADELIAKKSGIALAKKVEQFLLNNPFSFATLIANRVEGTKIVHEALQHLSKHKGRINVVTLGASTPIPNALGRTVLNFVPHTTPLTPTPNSRQFKIPPNPGIDYLGSPNVRLALGQLTLPTLYFIQPVPQAGTQSQATLYS